MTSSMAPLDQIEDSSDWLRTSLSCIAPIEAGLRCQVCKDFYRTPMLTSCSHTFCSLCIRRCLTSEGKCPSCRTPDQEIRLRRNGAMEDLVDAFCAARETLLRVSQQTCSLGKRKLSLSTLNDGRESALEGRQTRSKSRRVVSAEESTSPALSVAGSPRQAEDSETTSDHNLSACPICNKRMKLEDVFPHLDIHQEGSGVHNNAPALTLFRTASIQPKPSTRVLERLPSINYSILTETALRKKLAAQQISTSGPKQLLIRRHTEYLNLWNSNRDSLRPRSRRELLQDLDIWERTQGGNAPQMYSINPTTDVQAKGFDGAAWAADHTDDFKKLIAQARQKSQLKTVNPDSELKGSEAPNEQGHANHPETKSLEAPKADLIESER